MTVSSAVCASWKLATVSRSGEEEGCVRCVEDGVGCPGRESQGVRAGAGEDEAISR